MTDIPTFSECIVGYKRLYINPFHRLQSQVKQFTWDPGENIAECKHNPKYLKCDCGFYAWFNPEEHGSFITAILGTHSRHLSIALDIGVALWGDAYIYSEGIRAEKAQIVAATFVNQQFIEPKDREYLSNALLQRYGINLVGNRTGLIKETQKFGAPISKEYIPQKELGWTISTPLKVSQKNNYPDYLYYRGIKQQAMYRGYSLGSWHG